MNEEKKTTIKGVIKFISTFHGVKFGNNETWFNPVNRAVAHLIRDNIKVGDNVSLLIDKDNLYYDYQFNEDKGEEVTPLKGERKGLSIHGFKTPDFQVFIKGLNDFNQTHKVKFTQTGTRDNEFFAVVFYE
jgi:hypothetical protein